MIRARFQNGAFVPMTNHDLGLAEGELVFLDYARDRSTNSHNHQFAAIAEAWQNLPEHLMAFPWAATAETLRKHALIQTRYCDVGVMVAASKAEALRMAAYAGQLATQAHGYAIAATDGPVVRVFTPHSQSRKAMGAKVFQESKTAVLDWIADKIGVKSHELERA